MSQDLHPETLAIRGGLHRSNFDETSEALFLTSGFVYGSAAEAEAAFNGDIDRYIYSRYGNPTVTMFEERLRLIEGAEAAMATASGMAAVFASMACRLNAGDRVVAARALFGSCFVVLDEILSRWGIHTEFVDGTDLALWKRALAEPAEMVFLETPSNPMQDLVDIRAVADLAHGAGALVVVDNVFATPILQRPIELGADVVVYSTTKHIDGQGRTLGGAVLGTEEYIKGDLMAFLRHTGPSMSPFNAWVALKGLETLQMRVSGMTSSALSIAQFLETHLGVSGVRYPFLPSHPQHDLAIRQMSGGGTIVTFEVEGGKQEAFAVMDALRLFDVSNNLGDAKSLATHPATTTHRRLGPEGRAQAGITDAVIRLSIGLEHVDDLIADLEQALPTP